MKKVLSAFAIVCLMAGVMNMASFAHHGRNRSQRATTQPQYAQCTVEGCEKTGHHRHDGTWYCGWSDQSSYAVCSVSGCTATGLHEHDGVCYACQHHSTGHGCRRR